MEASEARALALARAFNGANIHIHIHIHILAARCTMPVDTVYLALKGVKAKEEYLLSRQRAGLSLSAAQHAWLAALHRLAPSPRHPATTPARTAARMRPAALASSFRARVPRPNRSGATR